MNIAGCLGLAQQIRSDGGLPATPNSPSSPSERRGGRRKLSVATNPAARIFKAATNFTSVAERLGFWAAFCFLFRLKSSGARMGANKTRFIQR
jgi:hypothetical protein